MLSVGFNPGELGANLAPDNEEYLKERKRRRSTVGNIWQLKAVLKEEVIDDNKFVAATIAAEITSRKKSSIQNFITKFLNKTKLHNNRGNQLNKLQRIQAFILQNLQEVRICNKIIK